MLFGYSDETLALFGFAIQKDYENIDLCVFLMADAVTYELPNQSTPNGYYNIGKLMNIESKR